MNRKNYVIVLTLISVLIVGVTFSIPRGPQPDTVSLSNPKFVIASWPYPDEYGQGIYAMRLYENSTGSWVSVGAWLNYYDDVSTFEWNASVGIKIQCDSALNATLTGASSSSDGNNYLRHNVTVLNTNGTTVFSQQNFTYIDDIDYAYSYYVILGFLPEWGEIYTVTIIYDVYGWF